MYDLMMEQPDVKDDDIDGKLEGKKGLLYALPISEQKFWMVNKEQFRSEVSTVVSAQNSQMALTNSNIGY